MKYIVYDDWRIGYDWPENYQVTISILIGIYSFVYVAGVSLFLWRSKYFDISSRMISVSILCSMGGYMIALDQFYSLGSMYEMCFTHIWALYIGACLYMTGLFAKAIRVKYTIDMGSELLNSIDLQTSQMFTTSFGSSLFSVLTIFDFSVKKPNQLEGLPDAIYPFWIQPSLEKYQLVRNLPSILSIFISCSAIISLLISIIVQASSTTYRLWPNIDINNCENAWEIWIFYGTFILFLLVVQPILYNLIRNYKDAHGILFELKSTFLVNVIAAILCIVWNVKIIPEDPAIRTTFPKQAWIIIALFYHFALSIVLPVIKTFQNQTKGLNQNDLSRLLLDSNSLELVKSTTVSNFTVQNIIFEIHLQETFSQVYSYMGSKRLSFDSAIPDQFKIKFSEIFRLYFCNDSPLRLNISKSLQESVYSQFKKESLSFNVFIGARQEIYKFLFTQTYPLVVQAMDKPKIPDRNPPLVPPKESIDSPAQFPYYSKPQIEQDNFNSLKRLGDRPLSSDSDDTPILFPFYAGNASITPITTPLDMQENVKLELSLNQETHSPLKDNFNDLPFIKSEDMQGSIGSDKDLQVTPTTDIEQVVGSPKIYKFQEDDKM